ncbi:DUF423 domain-containing protein [Gimibacter soli]|uniref:DUF423 domain-containing protein n=1 Tax=Gimibacter soli TaxID=3024400 RepID=A0AAE9XS94_9PROT|nr:DUF423 domain-containing protein [Gimibacter soli]WCL55417.1 DUF423 domain-containing protein [Gimibacter soli]
MTPRRILALAAFLAALATIAASAGSHALPADVGEKGKDWWEMAVRMQYLHSFALVAAAFAATLSASRLIGASVWAFVFGMLAFSGSLYWLAIHGPGSLGAAHWVTPLGGLAFITGWLMLGAGVLRKG